MTVWKTKQLASEVIPGATMVVRLSEADERLATISAILNKQIDALEVKLTRAEDIIKGHDAEWVKDVHRIVKLEADRDRWKKRAQCKTAKRRR